MTLLVDLLQILQPLNILSLVVTHPLPNCKMETEFILWFVWALLTITLLHFLATARARSSGTDRLPPGPIPLPIIGNLLKLGPNPHRNLARLAETYGPVLTLKLGTVTTIVVTSRDVAREVLQKKDQGFSGRSIRDTVRAAGHNEASLAWLPANQRWRSLRKLCNTHLFTTQRLNATQGIRRERVRELIEYLRRSSGRTVDVGRATFGMIINLISNTLFSADVVDLDSESPQEFKELMWKYMEDVGTPNLSDFFPLLRAIDLQGRRRSVGGHLRKLHRIFDEVIDRRLQERKKQAPGPATGGDFLDSLLEWELEENNQELTRHAWKCTLADLFFGGSDTTSTTMEWAMAELLRNPSIMGKVRAELVGVVGEGTVVDESDISRLPYLQAVVKETLRLHPAAPLLLPHQNETVMELCGYTIPRDSQVLINAWAISRDRSIWGDPEQFRPERFLDSTLDYRGQDFELIPFGAGRRLCPGLPLAFRMLHLILASLIQSFDWKLADGMEPRDVDMSEKFGITLAMAVPLKVIPVPIT